MPTRYLRHRVVLAVATFLPLPVAVVWFLGQRRWLASVVLLGVLVPLGWLRWVRVRRDLAELRRRRELSPPPDPS